MGKFTGVLLASDFDETIFSQGAVERAEYEAVLRFTQEGGIFTVSTGRSHRTFTPHRDKVPLNAPVILANGAQLFDYARGEYLVEHDVPLTAVDDLREVEEVFPTLGIEVYHGDEVWIDHPNEYTERHVQKVGTPYERAELDAMPQPWSKAILQDDPALLPEVEKYILSHWADRYETVFSNPVMLEITAKGATKGGMVLELARRLGIERKNVYCVGDNRNDIPMLAVSAIPFAPGNCAPAVREWGARIVAPCGKGCFPEIIDILDKLY